MAQSAGSRSINPGGLITIVGGILVLVGKFPIWGRVSDTQSTQHIDVTASSVVLIAGIAIIVIGLAMMFVKARGARVALATLAILGAVGTLLVAGVSVATKDVTISAVADELAKAQGADPKTVEQNLKDAEKAGSIKVENGLGAYLALAGGVVTLIGGIVGLRGGKRETVSGSTATGWPQPAGYSSAGGPPPAAVPPSAPPAAPPSAPPGAPPGAPPAAPPTAPPAAPPAAPPVAPP